MIFEARCKRCRKHVGYVELLSLGAPMGSRKEVVFVADITHRDLKITILCDECSEGMIDIEEGELEA